MSLMTRSDTSLLGRWWWTVDRWSLAMILVIAGIGLVLAFAATPPVAERIGYGSYHFVYRQLLFLALALFTITLFSAASPRGVRRLAGMLLVAAVLGTLITLFLGDEIKGASRWIRLGFISVQPSEFLKPAFAVIAAWLFSQERGTLPVPGVWLAHGLFLALAAILLMQPDVGMTVLLAGIWAAEYFMAGLSLVLMGGLAILAVVGGVTAYFMFDHVRSRVDRFLDPDSGDTFQVDQAMEAFTKGGLLGKGPGEGIVKETIPDAHSDFIFAVAAEEFGVVLCLIILLLFTALVMRTVNRVWRSHSLFVVCAVTGLITSVGLQAVINIASTLHLIPTKGMTLPLISYGGSSMVAIAVTLGFILALTRQTGEVTP